MIRAITITDQAGSGGLELGRLIADKLGWELLDSWLAERIARVADLDGPTAERLDAQAARWCGTLRARGINLEKLSPSVAPHWFAQLDSNAIHDLTAQLIQAAAEFGECVIVVPGAQCLLQSRADVFKVLVYAPLAERERRVQERHPQYVHVPALLREIDSQIAKYMIEHYEGQWLGAGLYLYDLCVNTSTGLDAAAELIQTKLMFAEERCMPTAQKESWPCYVQQQP